MQISVVKHKRLTRSGGKKGNPASTLANMIRTNINLRHLESGEINPHIPEKEKRNKIKMTLIATE